MGSHGTHLHPAAEGASIQPPQKVTNRLKLTTSALFLLQSFTPSYLGMESVAEWRI